MPLLAIENLHDSNTEEQPHDHPVTPGFRFTLELKLFFELSVHAFVDAFSGGNDY